jgi:hypothetical protein
MKREEDNEWTDEEVTEALNKVYEDQDSGLDPVLAAIQAFSFSHEDW